MINNIISGQIVQQNSQQFVLSVFSIADILKITKYTKRLIVGFDEDNIPIYNNNIQRNVENSRIEKIADFLISDPQAIFPTNIVLGIPSSMIESQTIENEQIQLTIDSKVFDELLKPDGDVYVTIIDGQHRIRGIEIAIDRLNSQLKTMSNNPEKAQLEDKLNQLNNIQLIVSFFIDPSLEFQAMIFSTINRTQKRVSQNLVYSLFGLDENDTPQKIALEIVLALNGHEKSPFYKRINLYGLSYSRNEVPPLSQATMVKSIVDFICENSREAEKDRFKKRKELMKQNSSKSLPFRIFYANNNDKTISDIMFYFFSSVKKVFKNADDISYWDISCTHNILQTTVGYSALMKILQEIIKQNNNDNNLTSINYYSDILSRASHLEFGNTEKYPFSNKAKNLLFEDMFHAIFE